MASDGDFSLEQRSEAPMDAAAADAAMERIRLAAHARVGPPTEAEMVSRLLSGRVPELRDPGSGRLHAERIADALGVSIRELADLTSIASQPLMESPDSPSAQPALEPIARVLVALEAILPLDQRKVWLEQPSPRWANRSAKALILAGEANIVAHSLEIIADGAAGQ